MSWPWLTQRSRNFWVSKFRKFSSSLPALEKSLLASFRLSGAYRKLFSEYIRRRRFIRYGACISCGKRVSDRREFDAGHFISAGGGGFALLFDEQYDHAFNRTISSFIGEALMIDMALAQQTDLLRNRVLSLKPPVRFEGRAKTARTKHRSPIFRQFR
jgi:hypothetical protein